MIQTQYYRAKALPIFVLVHYNWLMTNKYKLDKEWKSQLSEESYYVTRQSGTERPFTGKYWDFKEKGQYIIKKEGKKIIEIIKGELYGIYTR